MLLQAMSLRQPYNLSKKRLRNFSRNIKTHYSWCGSRTPLIFLNNKKPANNLSATYSQADSHPQPLTVPCVPEKKNWGKQNIGPMYIPMSRLTRLITDRVRNRAHNFYSHNNRGQNMQKNIHLRKSGRNPPPASSSWWCPFRSCRQVVSRRRQVRQETAVLVAVGHTVPKYRTIPRTLRLDGSPA